MFYWREKCCLISSIHDMLSPAISLSTNQHLPSWLIKNIADIIQSNRIILKMYILNFEKWKSTMDVSGQFPLWNRGKSSLVTHALKLWHEKTNEASFTSRVWVLCCAAPIRVEHIIIQVVNCTKFKLHIMVIKQTGEIERNGVLPRRCKLIRVEYIKRFSNRWFFTFKCLLVAEINEKSISFV